MRIAVLGAGNVGATLARKWVAAGHDVKIGVRDVGSARARKLASDADTTIETRSIEEAVSGADVVLFAIPGVAMPETIQSLAKSLSGKIVIDATNNLTPGSPMNSLASIAAAVPSATLFRAFSTLDWENFASPLFGGVPADLFYCGPDGDAQRMVVELIEAVGLRPIYVGGADRVAVVDGVASLWFALVIGQKQPRHLAFKVLTD